MELNIGPRNKPTQGKDSSFDKYFWKNMIYIYRMSPDLSVSYPAKKKKPIQFKMDQTSHCKIWNPEIARGAHGQDRHVKTGHKQGLSEKIYFTNK